MNGRLSIRVVVLLLAALCVWIFADVLLGLSRGTREPDAAAVQVARAEAHMVSITCAVRDFRLRRGELPKDLAEVIGREYVDPWGHAVRYQINDETYTVRSAGPDGHFETHDDLAADNHTEASCPQ